MYKGVKVEEVMDLLQNIVSNSIVVPDPRMNGATDLYGVPLDDVDYAMEYIKRHTLGAL